MILGSLPRDSSRRIQPPSSTKIFNVKEIFDESFNNMVCISRGVEHPPWFTNSHHGKASWGGSNLEDRF